MNNRKVDRRVTRTRKSLRDALIELILEKHYEEITVQHIIDRADVGRSTFYAHFRDKEDLLQGDWEKFLLFFVSQVDFEGGKTGRFVPIKELFQHLKEFHPFYRALVKSGKIDRLFNTGQSYLAKNIENKLTLFWENEPPSVPVSILSNYLVAEIFALLKWWLDWNMPYPPEQMDEMFHKLITPGYQAVINPKSKISPCENYEKKSPPVIT